MMIVVKIVLLPLSTAKRDLLLWAMTVKKREYHSPTESEEQEETSEVQMGRPSVLCSCEEDTGEYQWSFHGGEAGNGVEVDTETDSTVLDISFTEEATGKA